MTWSAMPETYMTDSSVEELVACVAPSNGSTMRTPGSVVSVAEMQAP